MRLRLVLSVLFFMVSIDAVAGCGTTESFCSYYENGELVSSGKCEVSMCGNVYGILENWAWENGNFVSVNFATDKEGFVVNGKPGRSIERGTDEDMTCYGVEGTDEALCRSGK